MIPNRKFKEPVCQVPVERVCSTCNRQHPRQISYQYQESIPQIHQEAKHVTAFFPPELCCPSLQRYCLSIIKVIKFIHFATNYTNTLLEHQKTLTYFQISKDTDLSFNNLIILIYIFKFPEINQYIYFINNYASTQLVKKI